MTIEREVAVALDRDTVLQGRLVVPGGAVGVVVLTEGAGNGQQAAACTPLVGPLREGRLATLRLDLLTPQEEARRRARGLCFNVGLLAMRLGRVGPWLHRQPETCGLAVGLLGVGEASDAALMVAAVHPRGVAAVVSFGRHSRLTPELLPRVRVPTLLVLGSDDARLFRHRREARAHPQGRARLEVLPAPRLAREGLAPLAPRARRWLREHLEREEVYATAVP